MSQETNSDKREHLESSSLRTHYLVEDEHIAKALELEKRVWLEEDYGDLSVYEKFLPQSRIFAAFSEERCVGVSRLFAGGPELPPFVSEMPIDDLSLRDEIVKGCSEFKIEEFGTVAVDRAARNRKIFLDLCRLSYRDATARGIEIWGIIMEPRRVEFMNKQLEFTFQPIGPTVDYQGGQCAAHIMHLSDVRQHMQASNPELYEWFVNQPLDE